MRNPTVREIARASNFSPATVARALGNSPLVRDATRRKIRKAARDLGWSPNPLSSIYMAHLRSTRIPSWRATLAYLIPYEDPALYVDYFKLHGKGAGERAASLGYSLEVIWLRDFGHDVAKLEKFLKHRGIPGLILNGGELPAGTFRDFDWSHFAAASWGFSLDQPVLHQAGYHYMQGMRTILRKLEDLGYRRIAMVISEDNDRLSDHTLLSAFSYAETHRPPGRWLKSYPLKSWHSNRGERIKIQHWLRRNRPDVVIGETVAWEAIQGMGWKVPGDVAFVSPNWSAVWPRIGGINHLPEVIGANSVDLVANQLTHNERGVPRHAKVVLNEGEWMDGPSVPPLPPRGAAREKNVSHENGDAGSPFPHNA